MCLPLVWFIYKWRDSRSFSSNVLIQVCRLCPHGICFCLAKTGLDLPKYSIFNQSQYAAVEDQGHEEEYEAFVDSLLIVVKGEGWFGCVAVEIVVFADCNCLIDILLGATYHLRGRPVSIGRLHVEFEFLLKKWCGGYRACYLLKLAARNLHQLGLHIFASEWLGQCSSSKCCLLEFCIIYLLKIQVNRREWSWRCSATHLMLSPSHGSSPTL